MARRGGYAGQLSTVRRQGVGQRTQEIAVASAGRSFLVFIADVGLISNSTFTGAGHDPAARECGLTAIRAKIKRDGHFTTKAGIVRRRLGRPGAEPKQIARGGSVRRFV
jgi:hypothetical protein